MLKKGDPAPVFSGTDLLTGMTLSLTAHQGKVVLLAFEGIPWCPPCLGEIPVLQGLWKKFQKCTFPKVQFVLINNLREQWTPQQLTDLLKNKEQLKELLNVDAITMPVLEDPSIHSLYEVYSWPTVFILGPDLKICEIDSGGAAPGDTDAAQELSKKIRDLLIACGACDPEFEFSELALPVIQILFGSGGSPGLVFTESGDLKPIYPYGPPVDPWGPFRRLNPDQRDVLVGLAISVLARKINDPEAQRLAEKGGLDAIRLAVDRLLRINQRDPNLGGRS